MPPIEDLSFETKHVCEQFITHHLQRCKEAIGEDTRYFFKPYYNIDQISIKSKYTYLKLTLLSKPTTFENIENLIDILSG